MDEGRFQQLQDTNSTPHPIDLPCLRREISTHKVEVEKSKLDLETPKPHRLLREAPLSHFRPSTIPPEILGEIFTYTLVSSPLWAEKLTAICLVCRGWRRAALCTPQLWTDLEIAPYELIDVKKVEAWLSRSGTFVKKVSIDMSYVLDHSVCPLSTVELARFLAEGPQLESLFLQCEWPECFHSLFALIPMAKARGLRAWDQLKSLRLECPGQGWSDDEPHLFQLLPQSLESLSLKMPDPSYEWSDILPSLPMLQHLSTLQVHGDWPAEWIFQALKSCPTVEYINVRLNDPSVDPDEGPFEGDICALPNMKVFRLHATDYLSETNTTLLRFLSMPSLAELEINFGNDMYLVYARDILDLDMPLISGDVAQLALQSNDLIHLKTLRLTDMFISASGLNAIFKALPSITHLTLKSLEVYDLPEGPIIGNGSLPQLQVVDVLDLPIRTVPGSLDGFLTFLQFRARNSRAVAAGDLMDITVSPVRKARIVISREHDGPSPEHEMGAQTLRKLGVDFSLVFP